MGGGDMRDQAANTDDARSYFFHQWTIKSNFKQNAFTSGRLTVNNTVSNKSLNMRQTKISFIKQKLKLTLSLHLQFSLHAMV